MRTDIAAVVVPPGTSLRTALARLDPTGFGVLLAVDGDGRFQRTLTDGDIRRAMLAEATLDTAVDNLPAPKSAPVTAPEGTGGYAARKAMIDAGVQHLPVLDPTGTPVGLYLRKDLDHTVPLSIPHMGEEEQVLIREAFDTNWIAPVGPHVDAFEKELAAKVGAPHAAALSSGTAALHLGLKLLGVRPGDTVFCSSLTFVASVNPVLYEGATPVFIDSEPNTWNMSPAALERALAEAKKTGTLPKAVIVVNLYGQSADFDAIGPLCDAYGVPILEDAAESLGATCGNKASGTLGRLGVYSFNGNKIITTSGGGMLVGDDPDLIARARFLATQGREPALHYQHTTMAYNYRLSNVLAAIGRGQLRVLDDRVRQRRAVFARYAAALGDMPGVDFMPEAAFGSSNRWLTALRVDPNLYTLTGEPLVTALMEDAIEARPVWKPMHAQPLFAGSAYHAHDPDAPVSVADDLFAHGLCLPSGSNMPEADQDRVIDALRARLTAARK